MEVASDLPVAALDSEVIDSDLAVAVDWLGQVVEVEMVADLAPYLVF